MKRYRSGNYGSVTVKWYRYPVILPENATALMPNGYRVVSEYSI